MINFKQILFRFSPYFGLVFVFLLFVMLCPPAFYSFFNLKTILTQTVIVGIAAMGATMVIISGGIDLSVGSQIALGTVVVAKILSMNGLDVAANGNMAFGAGLLSIVACMACGVLTGLVVSKFKIVPFIVTLGMMQVARGVSKWFASEQTVAAPANPLTSLMLVEPEREWLVFGISVWVMIILTLLLTLSLKYTILGRYIFAIGSNEQTARLCGINVSKYKILIYMLSGIFTGIAAIMQFSNLTVGDPTAANGMELDIIAAVVIGGGSLSGGEGSATGSLIGALIMAVLRNGCNMLGVPNYVQEIMIGLIIIGAVLIDKLKYKLR
jgi:ribose/xylose/arabinose/galactoside ABC-type transport system permease subunit